MLGRLAPGQPKPANGAHVADMKVVRIVANIATPDVAKAKTFDADVLGLEVVMN